MADIAQLFSNLLGPAAANEMRQKSNENRLLAKDSMPWDAGSFDRSPMTITCARWMAMIPQRVLVCPINATEIAWTFPPMMAEQDLKMGKALSAWWDPGRESYFNCLEANFTFDSGNLIPIIIRGSELFMASVSDRVLPAPGLSVFSSFLELLEEPKVWTGGSNLVEIRLSTMIFPSITLLGYFKPDPLTFNESSQDPNHFTWQQGFTAVYTDPKPGDFRAMQAQHLQYAEDFNAREAKGTRQMTLSETQKAKETQLQLLRSIVDLRKDVAAREALDGFTYPHYPFEQGTLGKRVKQTAGSYLREALWR